MADYKSSKTEGWTAAYVGHPPANPFIATLQENLINDLEAEGIEVIANLAPDVTSNVPLQIQQLQEAIALKPDIIFYLPAAPEAAIETIKSAYDAGIPVVTVQLPVDSPYAVNVAMNGVLQSMIAGAGVLSSIGEGDLLRVVGVPGIGSTLDANTGIENVLEFCPDINVVGEVAGLFNPATTQAEVLKYLATNPAGVDAVLQDGTMGLPTFTAFQESGIDPIPPINDIGGSQGFANWALDNPDYPYYGSTTSATQQAAATVSVGKRILAGGGPKVNQIVYAPVIVDRDNLAEIADPSADYTDPTGLENPPGTLLPEALLDEFFTDPSAGK
ncbi:substrate-binding domain-containing protein [Microbacterium sp. No. 7]|uniref:substrate-binding domain-containing protein n=1 Tax=Microbacterium sp. No. 7 TaxID=1714373 RepID=UPI0006CF7D5C|nr:substrate-binding domain-containing protein [Microbacterium sp. No. 7]ALJ21385.1 hypothetical protein AOA12_16360 [Microbacterium sp. No. 7]